MDYSTLSIDSVYRLSNGCRVPVIGCGTGEELQGRVAEASVGAALLAGCRLIDTAAKYGNEQAVGKAIRDSGVAREDVFLVSKVWNEDRGYEPTLQAFEKTLKNLGTEYLDLYLIHWPASKERFDNWNELNLGSWRAMTELYLAGRIRAIGVSNFTPFYLEPLMQTQVQPMVNQIEFHPGCMQEETRKYCLEHGIRLAAWSPLGAGGVLRDERLAEIARRYDKSVAQLCLRWSIQNGVIPVPRSSSPVRVTSNYYIFDFEISEADMKTINQMPPFGCSGLHPDTVVF